MMAFGIMIAIVLAVGLPDDGAIAEQEADEFWRVIYGFPYLLQFLMVLMFTTCFSHDSIVYNISHGHEDEAKALIKKVYAKGEDPDLVMMDLKSKSTKGSSKVSMRDATCDPKYRKATWVAFALCFFQ